MSMITTKDGTQIYYKDWGTGQPVVFCHGWPLTADSWEAQMLFLATNGYRCIAHDRRGHGRSSQPWNGNEMNTYADDFATLIDMLDLQDACCLAFPPVAAKSPVILAAMAQARRKGRVDSAVPPLMLQDAGQSGRPALSL